MEGKTLWTPTKEEVEDANITKYTRWLEERMGKPFSSYSDLWRWSTQEIEEFWESIWEYFEVWSSTPYHAVLPERKMPGAKWFEGAHVNYAEHVFRNRYDDDVALIVAAEGDEDSTVSWSELKAETAALAAFLREEGVKPGDRVAGYLPNCPEAVVGFLAAASIGAVWSCCSPEFGSRSVVDRFKQVAPKVFIGVEGYSYGGKWFDRQGVVEEVRASIPSIDTTIVTDTKEKERVAGAEDWLELGKRSEPLEFAKVPFGHPLWVLYTSGTTGLPKPIVHGHGGILLEHMKALSLHNDVRRGDTVLWYTSTGWMMWNYLVSALMLGSRVVLYDGDPLHPGPGALWDLARRTGTTFFGASAAYFDAVAKSGFDPRGHLSGLRGFGSTGSPLSAASFEWLYSNTKDDLWVASISGGTDVCTAFVGGNPTLPVVSGKIQCRFLGAAVEAYDESGNPVVGRMGELMITQPMPSMPIYLWGDEDGSVYGETYFSMFPGVWRHGDWVRIDEDGSCVIYGRSDATIKRRGVRAGTSEIYGVVESMPEVADSLVVDLEYPGGKSFMPLFVVLKGGRVLDDGLREMIRRKVGADLSPRFVPDEVIQIEEVPRTLSGKKVEVPVKRILLGADPAEVVSPSALRNPEAMRSFVGYRAEKEASG
ncbi:MAG TPA: acetoacetate--CoA ligase [Nitrososphaerales archaeon]|nr:acetoacetate--CoA ligase [Nitrososphaerales archaeon]